MAASKTATKLLVGIMTALVAACAFAGAAFAAPAVTGADYHASGNALESGNVDVATVAGNTGDTVFVSVTNGGAQVAKYIPYTLGEGLTKGEGNNWTGIVTLDISGFDLSSLDGSYAISIYESRAGGTPLYEGKLYGVYADLPNGETKLIGTRVIGNADAADRTFVPDTTLYVNNQTYKLSSDTPKTDGQILHFTYEAYDESKTIDGVVKFVDPSGNVVATESIPGLAYNEEKEYKVPSAVTDKEGNVYRTVFFRDTVTAKNPTATSFTIPCAKMSAAEKAAANFYIATIKMVDENDRVIATDSVNVTGVFRYTAPSTIYKSEKEVMTYEVAGNPVILLDARTDGVTSGVREIKVPYTTKPLDEASVDVTFNLIDGTKRVDDSSRLIATKHATANEENPTVGPEATVDVDGKAYRLAGEAANYAYTLHSGKIPVVNAYYVPEDYVPPASYEVTVNYVNFLTNEVIDSATYTSEANTTGDMQIESPATFTHEGVEYVRLDGQEDAISHSYYSGITNYTVYYRDVNDTLSAGTIINTIRVVYNEEPTTTTTTVTEGTEVTGDAGTTAAGDAGTTGAAGDGTAAAGGTDAADGVAAAAMNLNAARTYNVLDGEGNNSTLTNESGVDSNSERIEDQETPLASGEDVAGQKGGVAISAPWQAVIPIGICAVLVIAAVLAFMVIKRRKRNDEQEA